DRRCAWLQVEGMATIEALEGEYRALLRQAEPRRSLGEGGRDFILRDEGIDKRPDCPIQVIYTRHVVQVARAHHNLPSVEGPSSSPTRVLQVSCGTFLKCIIYHLTGQMIECEPGLCAYREGRDLMNAVSARKKITTAWQRSRASGAGLQSRGSFLSI